MAEKQHQQQQLLLFLFRFALADGSLLIEAKSATAFSDRIEKMKNKKGYEDLQRSCWSYCSCSCCCCSDLNCVTTWQVEAATAKNSLHATMTMPKAKATKLLDAKMKTDRS